MTALQQPGEESDYDAESQNAVAMILMRAKSFERSWSE